MTSDKPSGAFSGSQSPEEKERAGAIERGRQREAERAAGIEVRDPETGHARPSVAARAFEALAENVRDYAIFLMDPNGVITFWGEGARLIKWWSKDEAEGGHLRLLYPAGGSEDGTAESHLKLAAERGEYTGEGRRIRSDGSTFWAGVTLTALWDEEGSLLGFAKVTRDLTARRAADALLQSAAEEAEAANAAKSGFLATMSHEIRTPVNAVIGYLELLDLETDGPLTEGQRRHLARASSSARHLLALISEVLDFSRIEADRVEVRRSVFRLGDVLAGALSLIAPGAREKGVAVTDAVSGYAAGLAAWGDEVRVRQILVNLLANAIKFTEAREDEPGRITVSAGTATLPSPDAHPAGTGPWVYVRVEDTGTGIAEDHLKPIFEPFVQGDMTLTRGHGGTGLGLAISRRLARLMGGDVTARSELGVGSTFFLWLPAAPVQSLETGGLEGHGPDEDQEKGEDATAVPGSRGDPARDSDRGFESEPRQAHGPLGAVAEGLIMEIERILRAFVARVRSDAAITSARTATDAQIEDHMASFLADLAGTLQHLDTSESMSAGDPTPEVRDATAIQRVVAERHGAQRARLGWHEHELRREFAILREEIEATVRHEAVAMLRGPTAESRSGEAERALELLAQFLGIAEHVSLASYRDAVALNKTIPPA